jgi:hypothetical protein
MSRGGVFARLYDMGSLQPPPQWMGKPVRFVYCGKETLEEVAGLAWVPGILWGDTEPFRGHDVALIAAHRSRLADPSCFLSSTSTWLLVKLHS